MSNKFAVALKPGKGQPPQAVVTQQAPTPSPHERHSRKSTKHIGGYFDPLVSKQLRLIALQEDTSLQALLAEAIDMLFQSRQKPMIAQSDAN